MPAPVHCRAGSGTAAASATPAQGHLPRSLCRKVRFPETLESSHLLLCRVFHASQSWDEQNPPTFLSWGEEPCVPLCTVLPTSAAILCPLGFSAFMPVPTAFVCHQLLLILAHQLSAPVPWFPTACWVSFPSLLSLRTEVQGLLKALDSTVVFSPSGAREHLAHMPKSCCPWGWGCPDTSQAPGGVWCPDWAGRTDPGPVLCVLQHCWQQQGCAEGQAEFGECSLWPELPRSFCLCLCP